MQEFVNASFEKSMSTESALKLLMQFKAILQRESLQVPLIFASVYMVSQAEIRISPLV